MASISSICFWIIYKCRNRSVLFGIVTGVIVDIIFVILVFSGNDPFSAVDPALASLDKSWSSLIGVLFNLIAIGIGHWCLKWRDDYAKTGGSVATADKHVQHEHISVYDIRNIMKGIGEPMTKCYGLPVWLSGIFILCSAFHWIGDIDPELITDYGLETVRGFQYNGNITNVIAGLPSWTFASFMWYVMAELLDYMQLHYGVLIQNIMKIKIKYLIDQIWK